MQRVEPTPIRPDSAASALYGEGMPDLERLRLGILGDVPPRLRGVLHEWAFGASLIAGLLLWLRTETLGGRLAVGVYVLSLTSCLGVSAMYHRGRWTPAAKRALSKLDHAMIFVLIAGTYTPISALVLPPSLAATTLVVVWAGAAAGIVVSTLWSDPPGVVEVGMYVALGLVGAVLIPHLVPVIGWRGLAMIAGGGLLYIGGALIYANHRPNPWPRTFGSHEIFHVCTVLAASAHYAAIAMVVART